MTESKEVLTEDNGAKVEKTALKQVTTKKTVKTVVYIGPSIPGIAKQGTVYNNGIPEPLADKAKEIPAISALIVPVERLAQVNAELAKAGSALSILFNKVKEK
ncbi:MAG: hypothetical protein ACRDBO_11440 [Lachnospiraceae bacterium]